MAVRSTRAAGVSRLMAMLLIAIAAAPAAGQSAPGRYAGTVESEPRSDGTLAIDLAGAVDRAMQVNAGLRLDRGASMTARAERRDALGALLPQLDALVRQSTSRRNLRALGIPVPGLPAAVDVDNSDARLSVSQPVVDLAALSRLGAARSAEAAAGLSAADGREAVAVVVAAAYLATISAQARLDLATADAQTADALFQLASDRQRAGLSPEVDTLRAQVEQQARRQAVLDARNAVAKSQIVLRRLIGLDIHQPIALTGQLAEAQDSLPAAESDAYADALAHRRDYRAALERTTAAERALDAAHRERAPRVDAIANYGRLGVSPNDTVTTWDAALAVHLPLFDGGRIGADVARAEAALSDARVRSQEMRLRIAEEVETARLDTDTARQQIAVARSATTYAARALQQSRDRFAAGVADNVEVVEAQEALARANEQWVLSLYTWNLDRVLLARAAGGAEARVRTLLP